MQTKEEAKAEQARIAKFYNLGWWYGVNCTKCCEVYPKLMEQGNAASADCFYQCPVCGKKTKPYSMPWLAEDAWNRNDFVEQNKQMTIFQFL